MTEEIHSIKDWARSAGNREISLFSSHKLHEIKSISPILFIGGVHGDEPEGVRLAEDWLKDLQAKAFPQKAWVLIPCINPDGFANKQRTNGNKVDLNRNFPSKCWSTEHDKDRYYPGPNPGSEPEVIALVDLISEVSPSLIIHFHSWKPMIVYSNIKAEAAALELEACSGYKAKSEIGYPTPGSLGEYAGNDLDIGVVCIEEQDELTDNQLDSIYPRFKKALVSICTKD